MSDDWSWPYTDGYTGPYYSDGKFQSSVPNGRTKPKNKLAAFSRDHDTDYYYCNGVKSCTDAADVRYYDRTRQMGFIPRTIGAMPLWWHNHSLWVSEQRRRKIKTMRGNKLGWQGETAEERQKREEAWLEEMAKQAADDRARNNALREDADRRREEARQDIFNSENEYAKVYDPMLNETKTRAIEFEDAAMPNLVPEGTKSAVPDVCYDPYGSRNVETQQGTGVASNIGEFYRGKAFSKSKTRRKPHIIRELKRLN